MQKQRGSANLETKQTERKSEDEDYNPIKNRIRKVQKEEYLIKNACYSPAKYYLCKRNNKRSLLGRKQRSQVARSFPNRYLFSFTNNVTSLFSDRYIFIIILVSKTAAFALQNNSFCNAISILYITFIVYFTNILCVFRCTNIP